MMTISTVSVSDVDKNHPSKTYFTGRHVAAIFLTPAGARKPAMFAIDNRRRRDTSPIRLSIFMRLPTMVKMSD